jgi:uncharacterized Zn-binding protein involved in type VI secretion
MWVRKNTEAGMTSAAGVFSNALATGATAYSAPVRVFGAKSVSFIIKAVTGGPPDSAVVLYNNSDSPSSNYSAAEWLTASTTTVSINRIPATFTGSIVTGGGSLLQCWPAAADGGTNPNFGVKWLRIALLNGGTAAIAGLSAETLVAFDGDGAPRVATGTGAILSHSAITLENCYGTAGEYYFFTEAGKATQIPLWSEIAYTNGLPVAASGKKMLVGETLNGNRIRIVDTVGSTTYLQMPSTFSGVTVLMGKRTLSPDPHTL